MGDEAVAKVRKVKKRGLKLDKVKVVGILKKRVLKKLRKKTGKELKSILNDTAPLLQSTTGEEELSASQVKDVAVSTSSVQVKKRGLKKKKEKKAKSVTFANEEIIHLLEDSSELMERRQPKKRKMPARAGVKGGKRRANVQRDESLEEEVVDVRRKKRQDARRLRRQRKKVCYGCFDLASCP